MLQRLYASIIFFTLVSYHIILFIFQIRSAFYGALSAFIQNNTDISEDYLSKICPCIMYNLNESEPICVPAQWEAILTMLKFLQVGIVYLFTYTFMAIIEQPSFYID